MFLLITPATLVAVRYFGTGKVHAHTSLDGGMAAFLGWKYFGELTKGLALITLGCLLDAF